MQVVESEEASQRVLIVEDEIDIRALMTFVLERAGYETVPVTTVDEARAAISLYAFDVALIDLSLPDGRGDEVVNILRATSPHTRIVIASALLSAIGMPEFVVGIGDAFLPKPFNRADLIAAVASCATVPAPSA